MKKFLIGSAAGVLMLGALAIPALAAGGINNASPCGAVHGAFNFQNIQYGGGHGQGYNSSSFGRNGGSPASHDGAVGQESGATGYNNSNTNCQQ